MNGVERLKAICKERKIPIYRLEKDLGFGNGYVSQLKKGTFPYDRAVKIANYLDVSVEYLINGDEKKPAPEGELSEERREVLSMIDGMSDKELIRLKQLIKIAKEGL